MAQEKLHEEIEDIKEIISSITKEELTYLEEATRTQSASITWHNYCCGRITGSVIGDVLKANIDNPPKSLVLKITKPRYGELNAPALCWGRDKEEEAIFEYINCSSDQNYIPDSLCFVTQTFHDDLNYKKLGLLVCGVRPWLGVSPDGVINCSCCGFGVVEVKCPFSLRDCGLSKAVEGGKFYVRKEGSRYILDKGHKYYAQVQHEMFLLDTTYCDFIVWTPIEFIYFRIERDTIFWDNMVEKAINQVILPELLTRKLEHQRDAGPSKDAAAENLLENLNCNSSNCISSDREVVGCDLCNKWFHPKCLKLKRLPTAKVWYCPTCRKIKK